MNWYYLKGGGWIGPIPDEEKKDLMNWGVYPRPEEDFFGDFTKQENEEDWNDESDESEEYVEDWRHAPEEEDEEEENYTEVISEKEIEKENVEENKVSKDWKEEKEEKEEDLEVTREETNEENDDVLAVTDGDSEFWNFLTNYAKDENSEEEDELAVPDSYLEDKSDDLEIEESDDDELAGYWDGDFKDSTDDYLGDDGDSIDSNEQKDDLALRLDAQEERLKALEDCLTAMRQSLGALEKLCKSRLDVLEAKTEASAEKYDKFNASLQSLTIKVDAYNVNDYRTRLEAQDERLTAVEEQIEQVSQDINGFLEDNEGRLDTLEERAETFDRTCEKITADVQALSVRVPAFDADAWKERFDDQAEELAIMREQITGIERKINKEVEKGNCRLGILEEKTDKYEVVAHVVDGRVDAFEKTIQNWGQFVQTLDSLSKRVDALQKERETSGATNSEFSALKKSVAGLEGRASAFQTRFDSFKRETDKAGALYGTRFARLEQTSASFENRIQNLQNVVERNGSNSASLSGIGEIVAKLQNEGVPSETRVKNLENTSAGFESSLEALEQRLGEQTRDISKTINSQTTVLTEQIERAQAQIKSLETNVQRLTEESTGTAFISRINQLFTKFQKQNKETQEECRRLKEYVDEQRKTIEKLAEEIAQKAEETMGTAFIGRINQLFTKFQKQMKEQEEKLRRFKEELEEERRRFKEELDEQLRAFGNPDNGSKKGWRFFRK